MYILDYSGFIWFYLPLRNYLLEVVPSTLMLMYTFWYCTWLRCGLCRDVFLICCHRCAVPCVIDDQFAQTLSCCMCLFGTLAVDAPLAGCKRAVWASLGPTHRYFIDVWQQGQWANAPAGDEAAVSWMLFICMEWQWKSWDSRVSSWLPFSELERGGHPKMSVCDELFVCVICLACWRWILVWSVCVSRHISVIRLQCCKMHCSYVWSSSHGLLSLYMFHGTFSCQVIWCR